jgi:hypothetical protein
MHCCEMKRVRTNDNEYQYFEKKGRIPMGTNCAHLITDLFLHCYESQFMEPF